MKQKYKVHIVLLLFFALIFGQAHHLFAANKQYIYTDREYCLSGDTVWFKVWIPNTLEQSSNIVRVQFSSLKGAVISTVSRKSNQQWAEGFIHVPDSLSSGVYTLLAFFNEQRKTPNLEIDAKTLFVYNRFEEDVKELNVPKPEYLFSEKENTNVLEIDIPKEIYTTRENVKGTVRLKSEEILHATISANVIDPLADVSGGNIQLKVSDEKIFIPAYAEKDGFLLSGKVVNTDDNPQNNALTLLSISNDPPYFDYCLTDENGGFNFFLPNAVGNADLILQAMDKNKSELNILLETNSLQTQELSTELKLLSPNQTEFINTVVKANFINKLFNRVKLSAKDSLQLPARYNVAFYGKPTKSVTPNEFFDLPNFKEISRELLHGVQYRTRNGESTLRILNIDQGHFFQNEPLRLLNGIPIFKNSFFTNLKSTDISYIHIVEQERVFGDLRFNGVFAVSLYDKSNSWIAQQTNIVQYNAACLQASKNNGRKQQPNLNELEPDIRQNYLWEKISDSATNYFSFSLSDVKGKVQIVIEGCTKNNETFRTSKIIEVK